MTRDINAAGNGLAGRHPLVLFFRLIVGGAVFASEGVQKLLYASELGSGRFARIGLPFPELVGPVIGVTEIACGLAVVLGWRLRLTTLPLVGVMLGAIITTKLPILAGTELFGLTLRELPRYGLLMMLHEARTDLAMLASLALLYRFGDKDRGPQGDVGA